MVTKIVKTATLEDRDEMNSNNLSQNWICGNFWRFKFTTIYVVAQSIAMVVGISWGAKYNVGNTLIFVLLLMFVISLMEGLTSGK